MLHCGTINIHIKIYIYIHVDRMTLNELQGGGKEVPIGLVMMIFLIKVHSIVVGI